MLVGGAISWRSIKQILVVSFTVKVEFIACFKASDHGIWLQNFVSRLHVFCGTEKQLKIYCDNKSTVMYSNNNMSSSKSKHINIKFLVDKERV